MNTGGALSTQRKTETGGLGQTCTQLGTVAEPGQGRTKHLWSVLFVVIKLT